MACINPDGTISESAKALLKILASPLTAEEISRKVGQPLFKVRSSLREMTEGGLIAPDADRYAITAKGKDKI